MDFRHAPPEVEIDAGLVRALVERGAPELSAGELRRVGEGWDNVTYRLGPDLAVRLPRRAAAAELLLKEQQWLPTLAGRLGLTTPRPVVCGRPSGLFPWPWSVVEWIEGDTAEERGLEGARAPVRLAEALRRMHVPSPSEAPRNALRGVPLAARRAVVEARLTRLQLEDLVPIWRAALTAPTATERVWLHGDLHGRNVIVREGSLEGVIDWGDLCGGDVATDLACVWTLLETEEARRAFVETYAPSGPALRRAAGWAVHFASALLDSGDPAHETMGALVRRRLRDAAVLRARR